MGRDSTWVNDDGLTVGYGTHTADNDTGAVPSTAGTVQELVLQIPDLSALDTAANAVLAATGGIYAEGYWKNAPEIPANSVVNKVIIQTDTVATGTSSVLNIGLWTVSATTGLLVAVDADGLATGADAVLADFSVAGETVELTSADSATYLGKKTVGSTAVIVAPVYATAFTAGAVTITVQYTVPTA